MNTRAATGGPAPVGRRGRPRLALARKGGVDRGPMRPQAPVHLPLRLVAEVVRDPLLRADTEVGLIDEFAVRRHLRREPLDKRGERVGLALEKPLLRLGEKIIELEVSLQRFEDLAAPTEMAPSGCIACQFRHVVNSSTPVTVTGLTTATQISVGGSHACARKSDGTAVCWGGDSAYQLGDDANDKAIPVPVAGLTDVVELEAGGEFSCALTTDGQVRCWGQDSRGPVGNGATTGSVSAAYLTPYGGNVVDVELGRYHSCWVTDDGRSYCWGWNQYGQCGLGFNSPEADPQAVSEPAPVNFGAGAVL